jgi:hypothetical protein
MENQKNNTIKLGKNFYMVFIIKRKKQTRFRYVFIIFRREHYCHELLVVATSDQIYQPGE